MARISLRISIEAKNRLDALSKATGWSPDAILEDAILREALLQQERPVDDDVSVHIPLSPGAVDHVARLTGRRISPERSE